jgi:hypothetical protein
MRIDPDGDLDKLFVFEVDASHKETMSHFEQEYSDHFEALYVYRFVWMCIIWLLQGGDADDRSRTALESGERNFGSHDEFNYQTG